MVLLNLMEAQSICDDHIDLMMTLPKTFSSSMGQSYRMLHVMRLFPHVRSSKDCLSSVTSAGFCMRKPVA